MRDAGRAVGRRFGLRPGAGLAHHALVPELRGDEAIIIMNLVDDTFPAGERISAVEVRNVRVIRGPAPLHCGAFGDNQADIGSRPARIIVRHILARCATRRLAARHGGHDDAVWQVQRFDLERFEKRAGHVGRLH